MSTKNALYVSAAILIAATIVTFFDKASLIWATLMVVSGIALLIWGLIKDGAKLKTCLLKPNRKKMVALTLWVTVLFFGLGFAVGKLIYLWSH